MSSEEIDEAVAEIIVEIKRRRKSKGKRCAGGKCLRLRRRFILQF
jgi:bacterioferritin-associated ferredoxin